MEQEKRKEKKGPKSKQKTTPNNAKPLGSAKRKKH